MLCDMVALACMACMGHALTDFSDATAFDAHHNLGLADVAEGWSPEAEGESPGEVDRGGDLSEGEFGVGREGALGVGRGGEFGEGEFGVDGEGEVDIGIDGTADDRAWTSQIQSRTWWRSDASAATGLSAITGRQGWRAGAALTTQPLGWQPMSALTPGSLAPRDAFLFQTTGAHTFVLGYYDMGFADRLLFDTTGRTLPDGIARGRPALAGRAPNLLGGAYGWQQYPTRARGLGATAFAATHPSFRQVGGAHLAYAWDARNQVGLTSIFAQGESAEALAAPPGSSPASVSALGAAVEASPGPSVHHAAGVAARVGAGLCDAASEGAWLAASGALAYSLSATCELRQGLSLSAAWRDLEAGFKHPFSRMTRGRPVSNRRMLGIGGRFRGPWGDGLGRVDASWPRACDVGAAMGGTSACPAPSVLVREEVRLRVHPRHVIDGTARTWRSTARRQEAFWNHRIMVRWRYGARRGWTGALGTAWQRHPTSAGLAHFSATTRMGWHHPVLVLEAYTRVGLDAAHWRAGVWLAHRLSATATVQVRIQLGQTGAAQPLRHASAVVAKMTF